MALPRRETRQLFGTDGVRGEAGRYPLDEATVEKLGAAAASVLCHGGSPHAALIGRDTRESGSWISGALARGIASRGVPVRDLGILPTPGIAWLTQSSRASFGAVISASHNPYRDNGIKFFGPTGGKLPDTTEAAIERIVAAPQGAPSSRPARPAPVTFSHEGFGRYAGFLCSTVPRGVTLDGLRVLVDCAHGAAIMAAPYVLSSLGAVVDVVNAAPDGTNINDACGALHPGALAEQVTRGGYACGLAFDGDADRLIMVDETGTVRDGDFLLAIAALDLKRRRLLSGGTLVTTVMANLGLVRAMERAGIRVVTTPVGDRAVSEAMRSRKAVLGGEQSGHIIFRRHLATGDGILSAVQMLSIIVSSGRPLSHLASVVTKYPQVLLNTRVARKVPLEQLARTSAVVRDAERSLRGDGRVLVRYSGTENLLRVMIEGASAAHIEGLAREITQSAVREIAAQG